MKGLMIRSLAIAMAGVILLGCNQTPSERENTAANQDAQALPYGKATRYGLFRERGKGWVHDDAKAGTGKVIRGATLEFEQDTDRIPLRKGVQFGYRYWLKFPPDQKQAAFTRVLIHPEMSLPDGSKVTRSERKIAKRTTHDIVTSIDAYALNEDYELVEGSWIFQIWHEGKKLIEQTFTTYRPPADETAGLEKV